MSMGRGEKLPAWMDKVSGVAAFSLDGKTISDDIVLDFGDLPVNGFSMKGVQISKPNTVVEIKCGTLSFATGAFGAVNKQTNPWTIILSCSNKPAPSSEFARNCCVTKILGSPILLSSFGTSPYGAFTEATKLTEVYLVPNKVTGGGRLNTATLVDSSLISFANALKEDLATQQTITISNAATKAKLDTIIGTVSEVTANDVTYHMFTQDSSGTETLRSFIENMKGWVIA